MKIQCFVLSVILCATLLFSSIAAFADTEDDGVLTLEEAKELALKNDVQFQLQQSYIKEASEKYEDTYESNSGSDKKKYNSVADRASAEISRKIAIENAASSVRKAVFNRNDLKRASNFNVTTAYFDIVKSMYTLEDEKRNIEFKKKELDLAKTKHSLDIVNKNEVSQAEEAYDSANTSYNKAFSDLQNNMAVLSRLIDKNLDVFNDKLDMTLTIPDIKSIDLNKVKEDNMKNSSGFYSAKEQYDLAEYKLQLTEEQYDYYYKRLPNRTAKIMDQFNDMLNKAQRDFIDTKNSFNEKENDLDVSINNQYTSINDLYETYENQKKKYEDTKITIEQNRIKYQMGLITKMALEQSESSIKELEHQMNTTIIGLNTQYMNMTQYSLDE